MKVLVGLKSLPFLSQKYFQRNHCKRNMCIVFLHTNPDAEAGQFRLILTSNRDEYFKRPAEPARFWDEFPTILGGRDVEPGRVGGTWLGVSKRGRIAELLNVMGGTFADKKSRGPIVPRYLTAESSALQHLSELEGRAHEHSLFNLLAVDVRRDGIDVHQVSNAGDTRRTCTFDRGFLGLGTHFLGRPMRKVSTGLSRFTDVVGELGRVEMKDQLRTQLLDLLKWDKKHYPDPVLESMAPDAPPQKLQSLSSVFIAGPGVVYGTRTHTIVLVDDNNRVDFWEWTMTEPTQPANPQWLEQHYTFQFDFEG